MESILLTNGMSEAIDWLKLKENVLVTPKENETEGKATKSDDKKGLQNKK